MRLFFIRHALTEANKSGSMVKNYNSYSILPFDKNEWWNKIGKDLPKDFKIVSSPQKRCLETAKELFGNKPIRIFENLDEFDCNSLGDKKFWEISEEEFNSLTHLTKEDMIKKYMNFVDDFIRNYKIEDNVVCISHGFYIRGLKSFWDNEKDSPYELINSKNFEFKNLDMLELGKSGTKKVWRFI